MIKLIGNELSLGDGTFYDLKRTSKKGVLFALKMQLEDGSITKEEYNQCIELVNSNEKCPRCSNENIKEEIKNLEEICRPVVEYLKENYAPYYAVVITDSHIRVARGEIGIPVRSDD